jgi:hypothetical protein
MYIISLLLCILFHLLGSLFSHQGNKKARNIFISCGFRPRQQSIYLGACTRGATGIIIILRPIAKGGGEGDISLTVIPPILLFSKLLLLIILKLT